MQLFWVSICSSVCLCVCLSGCLSVCLLISESVSLRICSPVTVYLPHTHSLPPSTPPHTHSLSLSHTLSLSLSLPQGLKGVSFTVPSGTTTAIVGSTGAGKTTISRLLFRFYDPLEGTVNIGGYDIKRYTQKSVRQVRYSMDIRVIYTI